jgi:isocitrate dehydrogenase
LAQYWAQALANQDRDAQLRAEFEPIASKLVESEDQILSELIAAQGSAVDIGGYYHPDATKAAAAMRPSSTFNEIVGGQNC